MDEELAELHASLDATRGVVKSSMAALRTCSQFLADLSERLDRLEADLSGGTASEHSRSRDRTPVA